MKTEDIWAMLEDVTDPEVPVLTVVDLGVVRDVIQLEKNHWKIVITPTYTGCPAMQVIEEDIKERLGRSPDFADMLMMRMIFEIKQHNKTLSTDQATLRQINY